MNELTNEKKSERKNLKSKKVIPIFYASDTNYLPYLSVSILSLIENANKNFHYNIHVLHSGITQSEQNKILQLSDNNFSIDFVNVFNKLEEVKSSLQLRDYYTGATYYRIFIANMFPQYDKAVYLDGDTVVLGDISKLYNYDLLDNMLGAISDSVIASHPVFQRYTKEVLGIEPKKYFNAGILLMNLKKFRNCGFFEKFRALLIEYKFCVAQDQDYLNVLCKNKIKYLPLCWNTMPVGGLSKKTPMLVHYNLTMKPWHYADIPYAAYFWQYAQKSSYCDAIRKEFGAFTVDRKKSDEHTEAKLIALAKAECEREDNFIKMRNRKEIALSFDVLDNFFAEPENLYAFDEISAVGAKR